jgi:hypothetical protein
MQCDDGLYTNWFVSEVKSHEGHLSNLRGLHKITNNTFGNGCSFSVMFTWTEKYAKEKIAVKVKLSL